MSNCKNCNYHNSNFCNPENCPNVIETWTRIKELDLKNKAGYIIRYTMRNTKGEEKYIYWKDLFNQIYNEPQRI